MRGFGWSGRVLSLVLCVACGGKAEKDGPVVEVPSAGASGAATASGGSGGAPSTTATGGVLATTGGVVAAGGVVAWGGTAGATATGGAAPRPEPGTELWFSRGYVVLSTKGYWNLLTDLFSVAPPAWESFSPWELFDFIETPKFTGDAQLSVVPAQVLATVSNEQLLAGLGCSELDAQCAELTATGFARRMWRREVTPAEAEASMQTFLDAAPDSEMTALRAMVQDILEARDAYSLPVLGTEVSPGKYELSDVELAGLLAIAVTGTPPDEALLDEAARGDLDLEGELERLLESEGARRRIDLLIRKWFNVRNADQLWLNEDEPELSESMLEETRLFIENLVFDERAPVSSLVTAPFSFIDGRLAELYGFDSPAGAKFERVELGDTRRRGIPGQASFLTATSPDGRLSYILRGLVPLHLLCDNLPPSPPELVFPIPPQPGVQSRREQFDAATGEALCVGCHRVMNPVAYSFDHFDERGAYVEVDPNGFPVDSTGVVTTFRGSTFEFDDSADLMEQWSKTPEYSECFVRNAVGYLVGLPDGDPAVLDYVARAHEPGDDEQVLTAIRTFVKSDHFRYRKQ
jgi:hypothetical protein